MSGQDTGSTSSSRISQPNWDFLRSDPSKIMQKRSHDVVTPDGGGGGGGANANAAVDGFFRDMKKRKYATAYDARKE